MCLYTCTGVFVFTCKYVFMYTYITQHGIPLKGPIYFTARCGLLRCSGMGERMVGLDSCILPTSSYLLQVFLLSFDPSTPALGSAARPQGVQNGSYFSLSILCGPFREPEPPPLRASSSSMSDFGNRVAEFLQRESRIQQGLQISVPSLLVVGAAAHQKRKNYSTQCTFKRSAGLSPDGCAPSKDAAEDPKLPRGVRG